MKGEISQIAKDAALFPFKQNATPSFIVRRRTAHPSFHPLFAHPSFAFLHNFVYTLFRPIFCNSIVNRATSHHLSIRPSPVPHPLFIAIFFLSKVMPSIRPLFAHPTFATSCIHRSNHHAAPCVPYLPIQLLIPS